MPRRVSIRRGKKLVSDTHSQIRERQFQHGHALVFAVLQLVHRALLGFQLRQSTQEVALFQAVARILALFPVLQIPHPLIAPPARIQVRIGLGFHRFDHGIVLEPPLTLFPLIMLTDVEIDASVERVVVGFGLLPEALSQFGSTLRAFVGLARPALDVCQAALAGFSALGDFGVLDWRFRKAMIHHGLEEYGRLLKTIDILTFLSDPPYRRRVGRMLNKGEAVYSLARDVAYGQLGMLIDRDFASQLNRATCLSLLINVLAVWNTRYLQAALDHLRAEGYPVLEHDLEHLSPLLSGHINLHGSHHLDFQAPKKRQGQLRPLRTAVTLF